MTSMPAKVCAIAVQPTTAAAWRMFLTVLFLMSLLFSAVHAKAEGPAAVPNHIIAVDSGFAGPSATRCGSTSGAVDSHGLPSVPCHGGSCCGFVCHAPASLAVAVELLVPVAGEHYFSFVTQPACGLAAPGTFRPPIV